MGMDHRPRVVTEVDFRRPEFKDANVEDYEFNAAGDLVRKDRFEKSMHEIAGLLGFHVRSGWTCENVVEGVAVLANLLTKLNDGGRQINSVGEAINQLTVLGSTEWEIR